MIDFNRKAILAVEMPNHRQAKYFTVEFHVIKDTPFPSNDRLIIVQVDGKYLGFLKEYHHLRIKHYGSVIIMVAGEQGRQVL